MVGGARSVAGFQFLLLFGRDDGLDFLVRLLTDLLNFFVLLLHREGGISADSFYLRTRVLLDGAALVHGGFGDTDLLPTRLLVRCRISRIL